MSVISKKLLKFLAIESPFFNSQIHGLKHWRAVERYGIQLAKFNDADTDVISYFSHFHDCMRVNENVDPLHGQRATTFLKHHRSKINLDNAQFKLLCNACSGHTFGSKSKDITIATCWDADRLDIDRVGIIRDPEYFSSKEAKRIIVESGSSILKPFTFSFSTFK